ncbi:MAG: alpha/beta hydrolase [Bacilli bacterium]|nr:alpha/beta hydrolase [Bacilli bacterium]
MKSLDLNMQLSKTNIQNIFTKELIPSNPKKIIIYVHGLGSNKTYIDRFSKLLNNNIGLISFDFPGHGEDSTPFENFSIELCISYLEKVIKYTTDKYQLDICLFGSSFGGFVVLNELIKKQYKTILMCPAINFGSIIKRKTNIDDKYFDTNEYLPLYNDIKIWKNVYLDIVEREKKIYNYKYKNIHIISGSDDKTTLYDDIHNFCLNNDIKLKKLENGKHELYGYEDDIVNFIIKNLDI